MPSANPDAMAVANAHPVPWSLRVCMRREEKYVGSEMLLCSSMSVHLSPSTCPPFRRTARAPTSTNAWPASMRSDSVATLFRSLRLPRGHSELNRVYRNIGTHARYLRTKHVERDRFEGLNAQTVLRCDGRSLAHSEVTRPVQFGFLSLGHTPKSFRCLRRRTRPIHRESSGLSTSFRP